MVHATKATIKRLETENFGERTRVATLLEDIVKRVEYAEKHGDTSNLYSAHYTDEALYFKAYESDKPYLRGLYTRYPSLIECTFTHGNSQCCILDINKLVKAMLADA